MAINIEEAANRICQLIEDDNLRMKMSTSARINVKRFERNVIMNRWMKLFEERKAFKRI